MKKIIIYLITFLLITGCFDRKKLEGTDEDYYENSYYVITKNVDSDEISYFEVNTKGNRRRTEKFESEKFDEIIDLNEYNCFQSYIDHNKNKILNKYLNNCIMINQNGENVENNSTYQEIAMQISLLEHEMFDVRIYKINNYYYVTRGENVNIFVPYELYKYNNDTDKLELICQIADEEIIGFKNKS